MFVPNRLPLSTFWRTLAVLLGLGLTFATPSLGRAADNQDVVRTLLHSDVYITPDRLPQAHLKPGDAGRLQKQADAANARQVPEQFALIAHFRPAAFRSVGQAANDLRSLLDFSGVLIIVSPLGIGVGSDQLTTAQQSRIQHDAAPLCTRQGYATCAIFAGREAVTLARADKDAAFHDATVFWLIVLAGLAAGTAIAAGALRWRARRLFSRPA